MLRATVLQQRIDWAGHESNVYDVAMITEYFHTNDNNYLGSHMWLPSRFTSSQKAFFGYNMRASQTSFSAPSTVGIRDLASPNQILGISAQQVRALQGLRSGFSKTNDKLKLYDLVTSSGQSFPTAAPSYVAVHQGDTFLSIAQRLGHGEDYARMLALVNGYSVEDVPPASRNIRTPAFYSFTNHAGEYTPYDQFIASIMEPLYPFILIKPEEEDDNIIGTLVAVIVIAAATYFSGGVLGPIVAGAVLGTTAAAATVAGAAIVAATTTVSVTLASAAEQAIAVKAGWQDHFSFATAVETGIVSGLTAGFGAYFQGTQSAMSLEQLGSEMAQAGVIDAGAQLAAMRLGAQHKFNFARVGSVMLGRAIAVKANSAMNLPPREPGTLFIQNATSSITQGALSSQINHETFDFRGAAVQIMGNTAGQGLGKVGADAFNSRYAKASNQGIFAAGKKRSEPAVKHATPSHNRTGNTAASGEYGKVNERTLGSDVRGVLNERFRGLELHGGIPDIQSTTVPEELMARANTYESVLTRLGGAAQAVAGLGEITFGISAAVVTAETGVGLLAGGAIVGHGIDNFETGFTTAWTGREQPTNLSRVAQSYGANPRAVMYAEAAFDIGAPSLPSLLPKAVYGIGAAVNKLGLFAESAILPSADRIGGKSLRTVMGSVGGVPEKFTAKNNEKIIRMIEEYLGKGMEVEKPPNGSDLILRSADKTKQIRFDISNPHGLEPHINIETYKPRNLYSGDRRMTIKENLHVYPKNNLENLNEFNGFKPKF